MKGKNQGGRRKAGCGGQGTLGSGWDRKARGTRNEKARK